MRLSELQNKDIVDTHDGRKIGNIIDVKIDPRNGQILGVLLESRGLMSRFISSQHETEITFDQIDKIGEDVILINTR